MGAWIEIKVWRFEWELKRVAPYMGAWIEIQVVLGSILDGWSLPTWERGLKSACNCPLLGL